jgi:hypothetical protein
MRCIVAVVPAFVAALGCAAAADLNTTLRVALPIAETGFDPQSVGDVYSQYVNRAIFDENVLVQPWVQGYKHTVFEQHPWRYYDIDVERRHAAGK